MTNLTVEELIILHGEAIEVGDYELANAVENELNSRA